MSNENENGDARDAAITIEAVNAILCECLGFDPEELQTGNRLREPPINLDRDGLADLRDCVNEKLAARGWSARLSRGALRSAETLEEVSRAIVQGPVAAMGALAATAARPTRMQALSIIEAALRFDPNSVDPTWKLSEPPLGLTADGRADLRDEINFRLDRAGFDQRVTRQEMRRAETVNDLIDAART